MARALDGLKVLDFGWIIVAPLATKILGAHGATVVRVESTQRQDVLRTMLLYANGVGPDNCVAFSCYNNDKYGVTLNLVHHKARKVVERLTKWADVVIENFSPGTLARLGLDYEDLREWNESIIMLRSSCFGQDGPYCQQSGFGQILMALAGFTNSVGWPGRPPVGTATPYTDYIAPWYLLTHLFAALDYRRQTGKGQCLDVSQMEAGLQFIAPALLDAAVNGRVTPPNGNRHPAMVPHGVFRCSGEDRWIALAVADDAQWRGLGRALDEPAWCQDERFATVRGRKQHEDEVEELIAKWTSKLTCEEVMARLQENGVPAGIVANGQDLHEDPQLAHRGHYVRLRHPAMGELAYDSPSFRFSETPAQLRMPAPCLGQHNEFVCRKLLGMDDAEFVDLLADGVLD